LGKNLPQEDGILAAREGLDSATGWEKRTFSYYPESAGREEVKLGRKRGDTTGGNDAQGWCNCVRP